MTTRVKLAAVAAGAGGIAAAGLTTGGTLNPHAIGQPALLAASGPLGLSGPTCVATFSVPGKQWGGRWHWSPAILKPTRIETACISYPVTGGTFAKVSVVAP